MTRVWSLRPLAEYGQHMIRAARQDQITLRAAEASFFLITSAVPFCSLLLSLTGALLPDDMADLLDRLPLPPEFDAFLSALARELSDTPGIPLLSVSAAATLWSASRGISAVRRGLCRILSGDEGSPLARRLKPILATVAALIVSAAFLLTVSGAIPFRIGPLGHLCTLAALTGSVFLVYRASGGDMGSWKGALAAAAGWMAFEALNPTAVGAYASPLYGAFAAVTLLMLRLYFRMLLLFLGAEIAAGGREPVGGSARKEANRSS